MEKLTIVGWTSFDDVYPTRKCANEELGEMINIICEELAKNRYIFSGEEHQYSQTGVPVFSDGTCFRASMRCWGLIMARVYLGPNGEKLSYMDFYMDTGDDSNLPEYKAIDIKPANIVETSFGCTINQDRQVINESIAFGMPFMTNDKVLQKLYASMKN